MKARKTLTLLLLAALTFAACKYDDSALWEQVNQNTEELAAQAARIAALEAWQAETNTNIEALQTLLSTTDYITAVTPVVKDGVEVGFTISFLNTPSITIYHGAKGDTGDTPQIGAAQDDDGNWYWTLNGEFLTDTDGNPIRANGTQGEQGPAGDDAPLPQLATGTKLTEQGVNTDTQNEDIEPDAIYLSVDGGQTWTRVSGEKGEQGDTGATGPKGDSFFKGIDTTHADYVTFTLADGSIFQVPRTSISLSFDPESLPLLYGGTATIGCTAGGSADFTPDNLFIVAPEGWTVDITQTRATSTKFTLNVTAPADIRSGAGTGEILVILDNMKGSTTIERIPVNCPWVTLEKVNAPGELASLIGSRTDLISITVKSGTLNDADWNAIRQNEWALQTLNLKGATYNTDNLSQYVSGLYDDFVPLTTVKLPHGVTGLGEHAFWDCQNLTSIELPDGLTNIGRMALSDCQNLTSVNIPDGVTSIEPAAFNGCYSLTSIDLPTSVESIGSQAFSSCKKLASVTCRATKPPTLDGIDFFYGCPSDLQIRVPSGSANAYKAAKNWSTYADKIVAIP